MLKVYGTKSGRYCTDLDAYISKKQKVPCKCKMLSQGNNVFQMSPIYLCRSTYWLYFCIHLLIWSQPVITSFRVSDKSWWASWCTCTRKSVNLQNWLVYLKILKKRSNVLVLTLDIHINWGSVVIKQINMTSFITRNRNSTITFAAMLKSCVFLAT